MELILVMQTSSIGTSTLAVGPVQGGHCGDAFETILVFVAPGRLSSDKVFDDRGEVTFKIVRTVDGG